MNVCLVHFRKLIREENIKDNIIMQIPKERVRMLLVYCRCLIKPTEDIFLVMMSFIFTNKIHCRIILCYKITNKK